MCEVCCLVKVGDVERVVSGEGDGWQAGVMCIVGRLAWVGYFVGWRCEGWSWSGFVGVAKVRCRVVIFTGMV